MQPGKVDHQPAYVLHSQPWRETSLLVEVLTRDHGRLTLVARSARRPQSALRGLLLPFAPLTIAWFGKGELRTLHAADWQGGVPQLSGMALICGFYLNELAMRLSARDDANPALFAAHDAAVRALAREPAYGAVLRRYEWALLTALGFAPPLDADDAQRPIDPAARYHVVPDASPHRLESGPADAGVGGATLIAMAAGDYADPAVRHEARGFLRACLDHHLGGRPLATRELLQAISALPE
ncbi:DNA replication and repair protein RecO [Crenobacter luteus]|uniref:DNA repair protein RecO n=1 Tax=Crenobacter luteus TaxID=1452487 RepID=UPI00104E94D1|nr:DNA repair protein RecO [Crenobacter luteus]TCP11564.1 DNA replication and repair protein RecO [Crenobacter luteus]